MTEILKVENLKKHFLIKGGLSVCAVNGVSFSISQGQTLGLLGESGCGKTTVGRCVAHLIEHTEGKIVFMGEDIGKLSEREFKKLRPKIQIVFQDPYDSLNPRKKVKQILEEPLFVEGKLDKGQRIRRVMDILEMVKLRYERLEKYPVQLTQGEQQIVGIARAIATNPKLIVLDEPTSLLDIRYRAETVNLLKEIQKETGVAYIFISHDLVVISQLSHRIAVMYLGRIVEQGPTNAIFEDPLHPYTRALFTATLFPDPDQKRAEFQLKGEVPSPVNLLDNRCNLAPRCPLAKIHCKESMPSLKEVKAHHFVSCFEVNS